MIYLSFVVLKNEQHMDFFFFKAIKGESQLNVLDIGYYICIASDDINIKDIPALPTSQVYRKIQNSC